MPIPKRNRHYYKTPAWKEAKATVIKRANGFCEWCGVPDRAWIRRSAEGWDYSLQSQDKSVWIVLTVAHLNQHPWDNRLDNLAHLCQKCHNTHDAKHRASHARDNYDYKTGQLRMRIQ